MRHSPDNNGPNIGNLRRCASPIKPESQSRSGDKIHPVITPNVKDGSINGTVMVASEIVARVWILPDGIVKSRSDSKHEVSSTL